MPNIAARLRAKSGTCLIAIIFLLCAGNALARDVLNLYCRGVSESNNAPPQQQEFSMNFDRTTGDLWEFPLYIAPGCIDLKNPAKMKCSVDQNMGRCYCTNTMGGSLLELSRITGRMKVTTTFESKGVKKADDLRWIEGVYECERAPDRKF